MTDDLFYKIALTKLPLVGAITGKTLISYCGGVEAVFKTKKSTLTKIPSIGEKIATSIVNHEVFQEVEKEMRFIEKNDIKTYFFLDSNYPQRLKSYNDCPILLYYQGNADLNPARTVGIVGTRKPSVQGMAICEEIVELLEPYQPVIISGLAYGIDVTAHRKSVEVGLSTIGVLGNGLANIYPSAHRTIAAEMTENGGLLTEYTSQQQPDREHFPMRNRIVAGLCDAVIVVETALRGGSMITAQQANNYNKEVFAVPGRLKDKNSIGCNKLIKENRAILYESPEDIAYQLHWDIPEVGVAPQPKLFLDLSESEKQIVDILQVEEEAGIDKLSHLTQIPNSEMASLLLELEFKGMLKVLPGKRYVLV